MGEESGFAEQILGMLGLKKSSAPPRLQFSVPVQALLDANALLVEYLIETARVYKGRYDPKEFAAGRRIVESSPQDQLSILFAAIAHPLGIRPDGITGPLWRIGDVGYSNVVRQLISHLLRKPLPSTPSDLASVFNFITSGSAVASLYFLPLRGL